MATSMAQREATVTRGAAVRGGGPALAAGLTAPDVPGWAVPWPEITKLTARSSPATPAGSGEPGRARRGGAVE